MLWKIIKAPDRRFIKLQHDSFWRLIRPLLPLRRHSWLFISPTKLNLFSRPLKGKSTASFTRNTVTWLVISVNTKWSAVLCCYMKLLTCCSLRPSWRIPPETLGHLERRWRPTGRTAGGDRLDVSRFTPFTYSLIIQHNNSKWFQTQIKV